eukprot:11157040-Lingulodinium_polyedra.AAC.1
MHGAGLSLRKARVRVLRLEVRWDRLQAAPLKAWAAARPRMPCSQAVFAATLDDDVPFRESGRWPTSSR